MPALLDDVASVREASAMDDLSVFDFIEPDKRLLTYQEDIFIEQLLFLCRNISLRYNMASL